MFDILRAADITLFFAVNHLPHTVWSNWFFATLSVVGSMGMGWVMVAAVLVLKYNYRDRRYLMTFLLSIALTYITVTILKNSIGRPRPEFALPGVIVPYPCLDAWCLIESLSFPSFHAAASFCAAYLLAYGKRRHDAVWYSVAALIAVSRVYLGKHYPSDIIAGMGVGLLIGSIMMRLLHKDIPSYGPSKR